MYERARAASKPRTYRRYEPSPEAVNDLLDRLTGAQLFAHVGEAVDDDGVQTVVSWKACLKSMRGDAWVNLWTSVMNRIFASTCDARGEDWFDREWNDMIDARKK